MFKMLLEETSALCKKFPNTMLRSNNFMNDVSGVTKYSAF